MDIAQNFQEKKDTYFNSFLKSILSHKFESILLLLTIIGLVLKFFYFIRIELNSDMVLSGIMSIEFSKYHNYFFSSYYMSAADSNIFEVVTFYLLPQILSHFDPVILKVTAFFVFLLIVIVFSYIIFFSTKSLFNTLFFSALLSNWYTSYAMVTHETTILVIGILLILYLFKPVKNWDIIFLVILTIVTFSDSLISIWFTIPFLISNLLKRPLKEQITSFLKFDIVFKTVFLSIIVTIFKYYFIEYYVRGTYTQCRELSCLINFQIPLLLKDLPSSISLILYRIENNQITFIGILFIAFLIAYMILLIKNFKSISEKNMILFVGVMSIFTSLFYLMTGAPEGSERYLKFILIGLLSIFCMVDFSKSKYPKWILLGIIIINLIYIINVPIINSPNEEQYQLIDFLKKSNLSFGYGDYWDSNIITYLSHEEVIIRAVSLENGLTPYYWNSAKRWYENPPKKFFVIVRDNNEKALNYYYNIYVYKPIQITDYKNYKIFEYNMSGA